MQTPPPLPEGHVPCPRCGTAMLPDAPVCPNCGERPGQRSGGRSGNSGIRLLLWGLGLAVASGVGLFGTCIGALGTVNNARDGGIWAILMQVCVGAGFLGVALMIAGFIMAIVQSARR